MNKLACLSIVAFCFVHSVGWCQGRYNPYIISSYDADKKNNIIAVDILANSDEDEESIGGFVMEEHEYNDGGYRRSLNNVLFKDPWSSQRIESTALPEAKQQYYGALKSSPGQALSLYTFYDAPGIHQSLRVSIINNMTHDITTFSLPKYKYLKVLWLGWLHDHVGYIIYEASNDNKTFKLKSDKFEVMQESKRIIRSSQDLPYDGEYRLECAVMHNEKGILTILGSYASNDPEHRGGRVKDHRALISIHPDNNSVEIIPIGVGDIPSCDALIQFRDGMYAWKEYYGYENVDERDDFYNIVKVVTYSGESQKESGREFYAGSTTVDIFFMKKYNLIILCFNTDVGDPVVERPADSYARLVDIRGAYPMGASRWLRKLDIS